MLTDTNFPSPTIGSWSIVLSGKEMSLVLKSDDAGNLSGSLDDRPVIGFWDADAHKISFVSMQDPTRLETTQVFTGYLSSAVQGIDLIHYTLMGTYQAFSGDGITAKNNTFGWTASMNRVA